MAAGRASPAVRSIEGRLVQGGPGLLPSEEDELRRAPELSAERAPGCARTKLGTSNDTTINVIVAHNGFIGVSCFPNIVARDLSSQGMSCLGQRLDQAQIVEGRPDLVCGAAVKINSRPSVRPTSTPSRRYPVAKRLFSPLVTGLNSVRAVIIKHQIRGAASRHISSRFGGRRRWDGRHTPRSGYSRPVLRSGSLEAHFLRTRPEAPTCRSFWLMGQSLRVGL